MSKTTSAKRVLCAGMFQSLMLYTGDISMEKTKFLREIVVQDKRGRDQILEVHEAEGGLIFAVDATYVDQVTTLIHSPYDEGVIYDCMDNGEKKN